MHPQVSAHDVVVDDQAFEYLRLQKGRLDSLAGDREAWLAAYREALRNDYMLMRSYLPKLDRAVCMLDVGSGLSGISIMLDRHYRGLFSPVLLDGDRDPPAMHRHAQTFNDMAVARKFLTTNGVANPETVSPATVDRLDWLGTFDLVISLGSWCFHYPPETYLQRIVENIDAGTVLILDVRKSRPDWAEQLTKAFKLRAVIHLGEKIDRMVLHA